MNLQQETNDIIKSIIIRTLSKKWQLIHYMAKESLNMAFINENKQKTTL